MSRWFRHYAGMMRDDKLVRVAISSAQPIERVLWVWGAILESAAEIDDGGRFDLDEAETAYFLRVAPADVSAIVKGLTKAGRIARKKVFKWDDRQFASDRSRERVAAHRERKRTEKKGQSSTARGVTVTLQKQRGNAPELETELETERAPLPPKNLPEKTSAANGHAHAAAEPEHLTVEEVVEAWNDTADMHDWPRLTSIDGERQARVEHLIAEHDFERWSRVIASVRQSGYLQGRNERGWRISFDWLVTPENFTKILEGNYDDRPAQAH